MTDLDDVFIERAYEIVYEDHRPFSFKDFVPTFTIKEKVFAMDHGTFRNKISKFKKERLIELDYKSKLAFYTFGGKKFGRKHKLLPNNEKIQDPRQNCLTTLIQTLPVEQRALHDIHLKFSVKGIWSSLSMDSNLVIRPRSKDIPLQPIAFRNITFKITVHHNDVITVIAACTDNPIAVDVRGIVRLVEALTRLEYKFGSAINQIESSTRTYLMIPEYQVWLVTMWHFGVDGSIEFTGEKFTIEMDKGVEGLLRVYTKDTKEGGSRIRVERQEYPNKPLDVAINEKLAGTPLI